MANLIDATIELLAERPVDRITVRDVGERAGHHHRFVAAWFGGKAGLLAAVFEHMLRALPQPGQTLTESGDIHPRARQAVHVLNWLVANHPETFADRTETPLVDAVAAAYGALGLGESDARLLAQLIVAAAAGFVLFGGVLGLQPGDLARLYELQMRMVGLIAADPQHGSS